MGAKVESTESTEYGGNSLNVISEESDTGGQAKEQKTKLISFFLLIKSAATLKDKVDIFF